MFLYTLEPRSGEWKQYRVGTEEEFNKWTGNPYYNVELVHKDIFISDNVLKEYMMEAINYYFEGA